MTLRGFILGVALVLGTSVPVAADPLQTPIGVVQVDQVVNGFKKPWSFGFIDAERFLVTEKRGRLWLADKNGDKTRISGVPDVVDDGQGGLLDVLVSRNFPQDQVIYLTFAKRQDRGSGTAVARAVLDIEAKRLRDVRTIFEMTPGSSGNRHFGSRLVEAADGSFYVTVGERGDRPSAQDLARHNGSVLRITPSGQAHPTNPFVDRAGAEPEIWSFGHRNPQGLALDRQGTLWAVEHGARGGDEVNLIQKGANYGWPVISYGRHYSGAKIGEGSAKPGMEQPAYFWDPSIAPSGMMIYDGAMFPEWRDAIFIGSLKFDYLSVLSGSPLQEVAQLEDRTTKRVRDVRQAPDGSIWFMSEDRGAIYRMSR